MLTILLLRKSISRTAFDEIAQIMYSVRQSFYLLFDII